MNLQDFYSLNPRQRAQLCIAVLVDGQEAQVFLENDAEQGELMGRLAEALAEESIEVRTPLLGTLLREAIAQIAER